MASTTIIPFATLPECAKECGHLYDANGACVPPAVAAGDFQQYGECLCSNAFLAPFSTGTAGVCTDACTLAAETTNLGSIRNWYTSFCASIDRAIATTSTGTGTGTATQATGTAKASHKPSSGNNSWMSNHWQWVVFIVVVVIGIVAIWVGACFWHRRYLRRKDRQYALNNIRASTGAASGTMGLNSPSQHNIPGQHNSMHESVILANTGAAAMPGAAPPANPNARQNADADVPPGTAVTYDASTEKRRSNVLVGRRRN